MNKFYIISIIATLLTFNANAQNTLGFFLNDWQPKDITSPAYADTALLVGTTPTMVNIDFTDTIAKVSKYVYGNNGNPYSGKMNQDATLLKYLNDLNPHVIRWPGGNLSQDYFWDRSSRPADVPATINFWGGTSTAYQTNDDYYDLLAKTHSTGSICVNIAYARYGTGPNPIQTAAHYAADWVRYDNGRTKFWELGNENYGNWEDGYKIDTTQNQDHQPQVINGNLYGQICSVFIDSMRAAAAETGATIKIGAVAMEQLVTYDSTQENWNPEMMAHLADKADFYIVHSYYTPYNENSGITTILNSPSHTKEFVNYINSGLANVGHGPMPIALTEWNIFAVGSMQDVSYINGMQSAINVGELIKNKYGMACKWDLSNGWGSSGDDMGMFAATDEPGVTYRTPHPQFHYMYFFQKCFGDRMVRDTVIGNTNVVAYASSFSSGQCGVVLANKSRYEQKVEINLSNFQTGKHFYTYTLTGGTDNGDFSRKVYINGQGPTGVAGGPSDYATIKPYGLVTDNGIKMVMPPLSVIYAIIDPESIPDMSWAKTENDSVVQVKLTRSVMIPDTIKGFMVSLNGSATDSIVNIVKDGSDSTILLLTLNTPVVNTDKILLSYNNGNFMTYDSVALLDNPGINVENLLSGSAPEILDASTDSAGSEIFIHFNKKMDAVATNSFTVSFSYLGNHNVTVSNASFYNGDSTTYALTVAEPLYFDYKIKLSYSGSSVVSADGGALDAFDSMLVRNYSPVKAPTVQQAYTSSSGDSIILVFDKDLLSNYGLKPYFTISLDGTDTLVRSVIVSSTDAKKLIIRPQYGINDIVSIKVSYSGTLLTSYDNAVVAKFTDLVVQNLSQLSDLADPVVPNFDIFPNPGKNEFIINSKFRYTEIKIVDLTGKPVYLKEAPTGFPEKYALSLQLAKGVYIIVLKGNTQEASDKIIID